MGHARVYLTFDILRRVLEDYFNYEVLYVMNITDIDDKIILRARQNFLLAEYKRQATSLADIVMETERAWMNYAAKTLFESSVISSGVPMEQLRTEFKRYQAVLEKNKEQVAKDVGEKFILHCSTIEVVYEALEKAQALLDGKKGSAEHAQQLVESAKDVLAPYLDKLKGSTVTDHHIFQALSQFWENEYFKDMKALNIRNPDVLTRVSEYVPEIVEFVQKIISNGYAYEAQGSVYFDVDAFKKRHDYAKLAPWSAGHSSLLMEGEGSLGANLGGKKSVYDFALWKASKPGEPFWESPWGNGRPGWHIECSAMASDVTGESLDIHSGGIDLCFPHHDNELAQTEAYYESEQWVNYFLHAGHLHIDGQKMSKSLKNFITIREALEKYSALQIRLMVLLHSWNATLDYKDDSMSEAMSVENTLRNFFENVKAIRRAQKMDALKSSMNDVALNGGNQPKSGLPRHNYDESEKNLMSVLLEKQDAVHAALCDNINTPVTMQHLLDLISKTNIYVRGKTTQQVNIDLLDKVARYVDRMLRVFGLVEDTSDDYGFTHKSQQQDGAMNKEEALLPYVSVLSEFRDQVRTLAKQDGTNPAKYLEACDHVRDTLLPPLGVSLEDVEGGTGSTMVKFVPVEILMKQKEEKERVAREKLAAKEKQKAAAQAKRMEKLNQGRVKPEEMFRNTEWSKWDEKGVPTHDSKGEEVAKSRRKKLVKEYEAQMKLHAEFLAAKSNGEIQ